RVYDLGCSTGTTLQLIAEHLKKNNRELPDLVGIDTSAPMIEKAAQKFKAYGLQDKITLQNESVLKTKFENAGVVIMNYTLQFLPIEEREKLVANIYNGL